ncbi:MAG: calcium-binding protein [Gallionella sp.]
MAIINGTAANDTLAGTAAADTINGLAGADTMIGGLGNDIYYVDNIGDVASETTAGILGGTDTVISTTSYTLGDNLENLTLSGAIYQTATGNALNNVITVNASGGYSNTVNGGAGADTMMVTGNSGDTYYVDNIGDVVIESAGGNTDTIISSVSYTLSANVENMTLSGIDNINATGNALNNVITGNAGNNVLNGGAGNDTLNGGAGADTFVFNTALGATNVDSIAGFVPGSDAIQLDFAIFGGAGATGVLSSTAFASGAGMTAAATVDQHIIYNSTSGGLYYDADGAGGVASVQFATLVGVPAVTAADFMLV